MIGCKFSMADNYNDYQQRYKEWYGITITIPPTLVTYEGKASMEHCFLFGKMLESFPTLPVFYGGPVVRLAEGCKVVMADIFSNNVRPKRNGSTLDSHVPPSDGFMLNNCGVPWANWYLTNTDGVILNNVTQEEKDKETLKRQNTIKQANTLRKQYERTLSDAEQNKRTNCDRIYIVRIPNLDNIKCEDETLLSQLKDKSTECYGVEFYRADRYCDVTMLFFVNTKEGKSIDDYVDMMSRYISFDKDFALE